jgi:hypothetical protein
MSNEQHEADDAKKKSLLRKRKLAKQKKQEKVWDTWLNGVLHEMIEEQPEEEAEQQPASSVKKVKKAEEAPPKKSAKKKQKEEEEEEEEEEAPPPKKKEVLPPPKKGQSKKKVEVEPEEVEVEPEDDDDDEFDVEKDVEENDDDDDDDDDNDELEDAMEMLGKGAALLLLNGGKKVADVWKRGLNEEEVQKYGWIFDKVDDMEIDIPKILRSNLSDAEKERAINVFLNFRPNSPAYEDLARLIISRRERPVAAEVLARYDLMEKKLSEASENRSTLKYQVLDLRLPEKHLAIVWEAYEMLQRLEPSQSDYHKHYEWLQWVLRLPWQKFCPMPVFRDPAELRQMLIFMRQQLDLKVYGLSGIKEELMLFCMDRLIHHGEMGSQRGGKILAIEGSPGVGKTHLIKTLAKCWGLPFQGIAAGGCKDSSFWDGHGITYEGSVPGRIVKALRQAKTMNPVIYIDELDKLSEHEHSKDVSGILLHILDETQNSEFYDKYIGEIPLDLSQILWVLSINDRNLINPVLRDRLYILKVPDPKTKDKVAMVKQIMLPEMMRLHGLTDEDMDLPDETVSHLIQSKTSDEKGVRKLKQLLEAMIKRVAYLKHTLISLPPAAVYHAAVTDIMNRDNVTTIQQQPSNATDPKSRQQQKADFAKQTSFYFPEFRLPLKITEQVAEKLLAHYEVEDLFDYRKSGWIT